MSNDIDPTAVLAVVSWALIVGGVAVSFLLLRKARRTYALGIGIIVSLTGAIGLAASYSPLPDIVVSGWLGIAIVLFLTLAYFLSGRNSRLLLVSGILLYPLVKVSVFPIPLVAILLYVAVSSAITNAVDFGRLNVAECMRKADDYLRALLLPFSWIERTVRASIRTDRVRTALMGCYLLFDLVLLVALPYLLSIMLKPFVDIEALFLLSFLFIVLSTEECDRGLRRLNSGK